MTIQDTSGKWDRMPERIEEAVYGGLSQADQDAIEHAVPGVFANAADAIRWGMDQGVFKDEAHAQNTYELVKRAKKPAAAARMRDLWVAEVQARQADGSTLSEAERQEANGRQEAS